MAVKDVLELGTVSVGLLTVIYRHVSRTDLNHGTYTAASCVLYLLLAWYLLSLPWIPASTRKSSYRLGNGSGVWCSLMLPIAVVVVTKQEQVFLLLTVAVTFWLHIYQDKDVSDVHKLLLLAVVMLHVHVTCLYLTISGAGIASTLLSGLVYLLLMLQLPDHFPQSFTLGEVAIVTQLLTQLFHLACHDGVLVGMVCLVAMTNWAPDRDVGRAILLTWLAGGLVLLMLALFLFLGLALLMGLGRLLWHEELDVTRWRLFFWWVVCGIASILFVCYHGYQKQTMSTTSCETDEDTSSMYSAKILEYQSGTDSHDSDDHSKDDSTERSKSLNVKSLNRDTIGPALTNDSEKEIYDTDSMYVQKRTGNTELETKSNIKQEHKNKIVKHDTVWNKSASPFTRKFFHLVMLAVYIPGLRYDPLFLDVASIGSAVAMIILEVVRFYQFTFIGRLLAQYFRVFKDVQDGGELILTPLYLLIGCSLSLWIGAMNINSDRQVVHFSLYAGILSLGVGDTAASVLGRAIGKHRWPGSSKTLEGTLAAIISQLTVVYFLQMPHTGMQDLLSPYLVYAVVLLSLLEAFTSHIDNLVVSLFAYTLLAVM